MRVPLYLAEQHLAQHIDFETLIHPPAFTSQKRAKFLAVSGKQVAKCVLLTGPTGHLLAVLPATHRIDTDILSRVFGGAVRIAGSDDVADIFRDCEWGVVPPFGSLYGLTTLMDDSFVSDSFLIFEGYSHAQAFRLHVRDFERLEQPFRTHFAIPKQQARVKVAH